MKNIPTISGLKAWFSRNTLYFRHFSLFCNFFKVLCLKNYGRRLKFCMQPPIVVI